MSVLSFQDIGLKPALRRAVEKRIKEQGKTPPEYLRSLVERDLRAGKSFDEVLRPIRDGFKKGGTGYAELDALVATARKDRYRRSRGKRRRAAASRSCSSAGKSCSIHSAR